MENQQINPVEAPKVSSFFERMTDVFSAPGKLFSEVATAPVQSSSWAVPYILAMLIGLVSTYAILSNQTLREQALEPQRQAMQERVEKGEMTQDQMDRATEMTESSSMVVIFGSVTALVMVTITIFGVPLILWIIVKLFLKSPVNYKKLLELYGLGSLIGILNALITLIMIYLFDSIRATPGGSLLLLSNFDYRNFLHMFIASLNIFTLWQTSVVGIGIAKVSNKSTGTGLVVSFGLWLVYVILTSLAGWGVR